MAASKSLTDNFNICVILVLASFVFFLHMSLRCTYSTEVHSLWNLWKNNISFSASHFLVWQIIFKNETWIFLYSGAYLNLLCSIIATCVIVAIILDTEHLEHLRRSTGQGWTRHWTKWLMILLNVDVKYRGRKKNMRKMGE